jgi:nucleotide-binding universal stress UspA family protein
VGARAVEGNPAQVLLDAPDDADLLVVGNRQPALPAATRQGKGIKEPR